MVKDVGIKKMYEGEKKKNDELRTKLRESDVRLTELKKLYEKQIKWEETGEQLKKEMEKYKTDSRKKRSDKTSERTETDSAQQELKHEERNYQSQTF